MTLTIDTPTSLAVAQAHRRPDAEAGTRHTPLSQLDVLEGEAIHVIREIVGELERPVLLFSGGKDSVVMLHLAVKAFWPAPIPFPVLHVDTGHNFPEVLAYRDAEVERLGLRLIVEQVQDWIDDGRLHERSDGTRNPLQTRPLLHAITQGRFDGVFGGGRRDEEKARAKERIVSLRDDFGQWDPRNQRPELWHLLNPRHRAGQHVRAFPLSNWTELDVWRYIEREGIDLPSLYYAHEREVFSRNGMWLAVGPWSQPETRSESSDGPSAIAPSVTCPAPGDREPGLHGGRSCRRSRHIDLTERGATRADDRISEAAMEDRKKEGYF